MKQKTPRLLLLGCLMLASFGAFAQAINETFANVPGLFTSGWAQQNLSTPAGTNPNWFQGDNTVFTANSLPDNSYIAVNYNCVAGAANISNWLFTPTRTFNNGDIVTFFTRTTTGTYPDNLQVRLSTNGASVNVGTTNASVGDFTNLLLEINPTLSTTGYPLTWTQYTVTISGLPAATSGRIAFRYAVTNGGPTGLNSDYIGIDDYVYTPSGAGAPNLTVTQAGEYTLIPLTQSANMPLSAKMNNTGTAACSNATMTVKVYQLPNTTTPVQTFSSTPASLAAGASTTVNLGTYTPPANGNYLFKYTTSGTGNTVNASDTLNYNVTINPKVYARDNGTSAQAIGAGQGTRVIIGNNFTVNTSTILDSVLFFLYTGAPGLGDTVRVRIRNTVAGVPQNTADIGFSAPYVLASTDTSGAVLTLPITNASAGTLTLAPGTYFVGIEKYLTGDNYGLQCASNIFTPNTVYANINNGAFSPLNSLLAGFNYTPIIRMITCNNTASTATHVACGSFTWINGTTYTSSNNTATYTVPNATGCDSVITLNLTINPVSNAAFNYSSNTICTTGSNAIPTISSPGTFSVAQSGLVFANTTTGEINVSASQSGTYTVTYTTGGTCPTSTTQTLTLTSAPSAGFTYDNAAYCTNANSPQISFASGSSAGTFTASPAGLTIDPASGAINLSTSLPNSYTVTNTILASGACPQVTANYTVVVNALPNVTFQPSVAAICQGAPSVTLQGGSPAGGTYSGTDVVGNSFTPATAGSSTVTYTYADANGCSNSATATITVNALPTVSFAIADDSVCTEDPAVVLQGGSPAGGTYSGTNVNAGLFTPSTLGNTVLTYAYTDANGCSNSATASIEVLGCAGLDEATAGNGIACYPNPSTGLFTVTLPQSAAITAIRCYNSTGQLVWEKSDLSDTVHQFDMQSFAKGIYTLELRSDLGNYKERIILD